MDFDNLDELAKFVNKNVIKESLKTDVADKVIEIAKDHVDEDIYDVYTPKIYERTGQLKESFKAIETEDGIEIINTRRDGDRNIPEIIEYGQSKSSQGYEYPAYYPSGDNFIQPRPFIENTRIELEHGRQHIEALKESLRKKGYDVE